MRIAIGVEYNGRDFHGWEIQRHGRTVQGCLESALAAVADHPVRTICAGRTDAGVHSTGQVAHFDTSSLRPERGWMMGANRHLPADAAVTWARVVDESFHARYAARARRYRYLVLNRAVRPALERGRLAWEYRPLDAERMQAGADHLVGEHDFSAFRGAGCQARSTVRRVYRIAVRRRADVVAIDVTANAFLMHMVRNIAGVLLAVGSGREPPAWAGEVLRGRERARGGVTAAADGLYLVRVDYPEPWRFPPVSPPWGLW